MKCPRPYSKRKGLPPPLLVHSPVSFSRSLRFAYPTLRVDVFNMQHRWMLCYPVELLG